METGCYVGGHEGWRGVLSVIELASDHGMKLSDEDHDAMARFDSGDDEDGSVSDYVYSLADEAEAYLNDQVAEDGFSFGWHYGEFFYWSDETWAEDSY